MKVATVAYLPKEYVHLMGDKYTMDFEVAWVGTGLLLLWRRYKTEVLFDTILIQYM
jgi:hypothetical protein